MITGKHNDKLQKNVHPSIFLTASHTCDKVKGAVQWTFHHSVVGQESNMSNKSKLSSNNYEHSLMMAGKSAADTGSDLSGQNAAMAAATVFTLTLCVSFNLGSSQSVFQREVNEGGVLLHCLDLASKNRLVPTCKSQVELICLKCDFQKPDLTVKAIRIYSNSFLGGFSFSGF